MKNALLSLVFLCFLTSASYSQESLSKQTYSSPLSFNTAFTGYTGGSRLQSQYVNSSLRSDQSSYDYNISYDHYLNSLKGGLGIRLSNQNGLGHIYSGRNGTVASNTAGILLSKKLIERKNFVLMLGSGIDYYERIVDEELIFFDARRAFVNFSDQPVELKVARGIAISPGLVFVANQLIGGFSVKNVNEPDISLNKHGEEYLPRTYNVHLAYQFFNDESKFRISPDIIYSSQGGSNEFLIGTHAKYKWARLGVRYQHVFYSTDGFLTYIGYQGKRWSINHSYSFVSSRLSTQSYGINDVNVTYRFNRKTNKRQLNLPDIIAF